MDSEQAPFDFLRTLERLGCSKEAATLKAQKVLYQQGDDANSVLYLQTGKVKLSVVSAQGKEAVVAILEAKSFFGEGCLLGQPARLATATALSACTVLTIRKPAMAEALHQDHDFANRFIHYLLTRQQRVQDDLVDQLLNSSEKRLARILLLLTHFGKEGRSEEIPKISQTTLAEMTGTTRSRVNQFLKKFKRLGFIDYNGGLVVNSSLLSVVLADQPNDP